MIKVGDLVKLYQGFDTPDIEVRVLKIIENTSVVKVKYEPDNTIMIVDLGDLEEF